MKKYWNDVLTNWEMGKYLKIPKNISKPFYWRTCPIYANKHSIYRDEFIETNSLPKKNEYTSFLNNPISLKKTQKNIIVAPNMSNDTILVIPGIDTFETQSGKVNEINYSSLFYFMKNAPIPKQIELWKVVSYVIRKQLYVWPKLWVSVHGNGVGYLHIRISKLPKYYGNSVLAEYK